MLRKKVRRVLVAGIVSLSLILGQGVVLAADQSTSVDSVNVISKIRTVSSASFEGVYSVTGDGVRVRLYPNTSSSSIILGKLYKDDEFWVEYSSSDGQWAHGQTSSGLYGWVNHAYLTRVIWDDEPIY